MSWTESFITGRRLALTFGLATLMAASCYANQDALVKSVGDALAEGTATRNQLDATMASLNKLLATPPGNDLRPAYQAYVENVDKTKQDAGITRKRVDQMNADSANYFGTWKSDNEAISNEKLRKVSNKRLETVQKDYRSSLASLQGAAAKFTPFLSDLSDIQTALSNDLTANGLKAAKGVFKKANKDHSEVRKEIDKSTHTFQAMQTNLMPVAAAPK